MPTPPLRPAAHSCFTTPPHPIRLNPWKNYYGIHSNPLVKIHYKTGHIILLPSFSLSPPPSVHLRIAKSFPPSLPYCSGWGGWDVDVHTAARVRSRVEFAHGACRCSTMPEYGLMPSRAVVACVSRVKKGRSLLVVVFHDGRWQRGIYLVMAS